MSMSAKNRYRNNSSSVNYRKNRFDVFVIFLSLLSFIIFCLYFNERYGILGTRFHWFRKNNSSKDMLIKNDEIEYISVGEYGGKNVDNGKHGPSDKKSKQPESGNGVVNKYSAQDRQYLDELIGKVVE
jgi:hypothetical protein